MPECPSCQRDVRSVAPDPWCHDCGGRFSELGGTAPGIALMTTTEPRIVVFPWGLLVSVNKRAGGMVGWTSTEYRERLQAMQQAAAVQASGWPVLTGPVRLEVWYHPPDNRRRDCSNLDKGVMDALIGCVYEDDAQVVEWAGYKMPVSAEPRAVVEVTGLAGRVAA